MAGFLVRDANLKVTMALPTNATAKTSTSLDLENSARGDFTARTECLLSVPALNTTQLADNTTDTWDIVISPNSDLSGPTTLINKAIVQTGAGGAGAAAATYRFKPPTNVSRYVGMKCTESNATNQSAVSATLEVLC